MKERERKRELERQAVYSSLCPLYLATLLTHGRTLALVFGLFANLPDRQLQFAFLFLSHTKSFVYSAPTLFLAMREREREDADGERELEKENSRVRVELSGKNLSSL